MRVCAQGFPRICLICHKLYVICNECLPWDMQDLAKRILPLCENYVVVSQFAEARSHFKHGLVNHAFASALRAILQVVILIIFCFRIYLIFLILLSWYVVVSGSCFQIESICKSQRVFTSGR